MFENRFGRMSNKEAECFWRVLKRQDFKGAFINLVDMEWWADSQITDDFERETFLYREFMKYYTLILDLSEKEFAELEFKGDKLMMINRLKYQLDHELKRIEKHEYETVES